MVICTQCYTELPRECFSANQLNRHKNRCLSCVGVVPPTVQDASSEVSRWVTCSRCFSVLPVQFFSSTQLVVGQMCMPCIGAAMSGNNLLLASLSWADGVSAHGGHTLDSGEKVADGSGGAENWTDGVSSDGLQTLDHCETAVDGNGDPQGDNPYSSFSINDGIGHGLFSLPEEPREVLVVNSLTSGAYRALCHDALATSVVALDAEWKPDTTSGSNNPIAVLQLAFPTSMRVYVVQINRLRGVLPVEVRQLLLNPMIQKAGFAVNIQDIAKFHRSRIRVSSTSLLDMQECCAALLSLPDRSMLGLKRAAEELLMFYGMDKDKRISCSKWDSVDLTPEQVRYAALDAWVTLRLFYYCSQANSYVG